MELKELLELAERATEGPWFTQKHNGHDHAKWGGLVEIFHSEDDGGPVAQVFGSPLDQTEADAAFIAASNPSIVSALVKVAEAATWFCKGTSANFDFPQLAELKLAVAELSRRLSGVSNNTST